MPLYVQRHSLLPVSWYTVHLRDAVDYSVLPRRRSCGAQLMQKAISEWPEMSAERVAPDFVRRRHARTRLYLATLHDVAVVCRRRLAHNAHTQRHAGAGATRGEMGDHRPARLACRDNPRAAAFDEPCYSTGSQYQSLRICIPEITDLRNRTIGR